MYKTSSGRDWTDHDCPSPDSRRAFDCANSCAWTASSSSAERPEPLNLVFLRVRSVCAEAVYQPQRDLGSHRSLPYLCCLLVILHDRLCLLDELFKAQRL